MTNYKCLIVCVIDACLISHDQIVSTRKASVSFDSESEEEYGMENEEGEEEEDDLMDAEEETENGEKGEKISTGCVPPLPEMAPTLRPLAHSLSKNSNKAGAVQRQLPDWITHAHIIENDIPHFSK